MSHVGKQYSGRLCNMVKVYAQCQVYVNRKEKLISKSFQSQLK